MSAQLPIGGFLPVPLAMMIPFMGTQSAIMAKQFGENYEYGRRRIKSLSNEDFNKLTPQQLMATQRAELNTAIPEIMKSIEDMRELQNFIVKEFVALMAAIPKALQEGIDENILHPLFDLITQSGVTSATNPNLDKDKFNPPGTSTATSGNPYSSGTTSFEGVMRTRTSEATIARAKASEEGKRKNEETLTRYAGFDFDTSIVGTGKTRQDLLNAIAFYERTIAQQQKLVGPHLRNKEHKGIPLPREAKMINHQLQAHLNILAQYKKALNYISSNNLSHT